MPGWLWPPARLSRSESEQLSPRRWGWEVGGMSPASWPGPRVPRSPPRGGPCRVPARGRTSAAHLGSASPTCSAELSARRDPHTDVTAAPRRPLASGDHEAAPARDTAGPEVSPGARTDALGHDAPPAAVCSGTAGV
ncbi:unnamed protein product, partial [Rangifer tarandus platyrhynchus]